MLSPEAHCPDPIVISGAGLVTCLGLDKQTSWQGVKDCRSAIGVLTKIEQSPLPHKHGGQAPDLPKDYQPRLPREARYLRYAIEQALGEAKIAPTTPYQSKRCAIVLGTTLHGMPAAGRYFRDDDPTTLETFLPSATLHLAADDLEISGLGMTTCSACSSSLSSLGLAMTLLASGDYDMVVAGGYDVISEFTYSGFNSLRLVADGLTRPFCKQREGMNIGEGYGAIVLERKADALARNITPLAHVLGFGETADAYHLTHPHPDGRGAARAIQQAINNANLTINEIDLICAHATGTQGNDASEFAALDHVFAGRLPLTPVVAYKSHIGHTLGGAGIAELIFSTCALRDQVLPPTRNVLPGELEYEKLTLNDKTPQRSQIDVTLNMSLGFGGANTCVVLQKHQNVCDKRSVTSRDRQGAVGVVLPGKGKSLPDGRGSYETRCLAPSHTLSNTQYDSPPQTHPLNKVVITGVGVFMPGIPNNDALVQRLENKEAKPLSGNVNQIDEKEFARLLKARRVRRMGNYVKLALAATTLAWQDAGLTWPAQDANSWYALLGTCHGSVTQSEQFYREIIQSGIEAANPVLFAESVLNAGAAHTSLMLGLGGACQVLVGSRTAGLDALRLATLRIASGQWEHAVVGVADEYSSLVDTIYKHYGLSVEADKVAAPFTTSGASGFRYGCGGVTFILESQAAAQARNATVRGTIEATATAFGRPRQVRQTIDLVQQVIQDLDSPQYMMTSANGTWLDRVEAAALRKCAVDRRIVVSSICGHIGEAFSVAPLAGIAAVLLSGKMPTLLGESLLQKGGLRGATGDEKPDTFGALATDYTGLAAGVKIAIPRPGMEQ